MWKPNSKWTWSFLLATIAQGVIGLAIEGYIFAHFQGELVPEAANPRAADNAKWARAIPTFLGLLIFGFVYEILLTWDALRSQNTIQIIGLCIMNLGILVYTAIQIDQVKEAANELSSKLKAFLPPTYWADVRAYLISLPCLVALGTAALSFLAWKLYGEFGWKIYKQIGADLRMKRRFLVYQVYIAILKFDFFLFLGFEVQFLVLVGNTADSEKYLTIVAIPITVLILLFAAWSTQRENIIGMLFTMVVYLCMVAYFIFKLVRMYDSPRKDDYAPASRTLTVFASFTLILIIITIFLASWCMYNFNKGLKAHLLNKRPESIEEPPNKGSYDLDYSPNNNNTYGAYRPHGGSRMEID